jgi:hypothetical protein
VIILPVLIINPSLFDIRLRCGRNGPTIGVSSRS